MQYLEVMGSSGEVPLVPENWEEIYSSPAYVVNLVNLLKEVLICEEMFMFQIEGRKEKGKKR